MKSDNRRRYIKCKHCGGVLYFEKIRQLRYCSCRKIAVDWSLMADNFRIVGSPDDYIAGVE